MKKVFLIIVMLLISNSLLFSQVAINADGSAAAASAMLDIKSTNKGLLPPRMTKVELNAISSPADGLIVYCMDCGLNSTGTLSMFTAGSWYTINKQSGNSIGDMQFWNGTDWVAVPTYYATDIAGLKSDIAALSLKADGVFALQVQLTATTAQLTALQAAVAALPTASSIAAIMVNLNVVSAKADAIMTAINSLFTMGNANAAAQASIQATLNNIIAAKVVADGALNNNLDVLGSSLALAIADGNAASDAKTEAEILAAKSAILTSLNVGFAAADQNMKDKVDAAISALQAAIATNSSDVATRIAALQNIVLSVILDKSAQTDALISASFAALNAALKAGGSIPQ